MDVKSLNPLPAVPPVKRVDRKAESQREHPRRTKKAMLEAPEDEDKGGIDIFA